MESPRCFSGREIKKINCLPILSHTLSLSPVAGPARVEVVVVLLLSSTAAHCILLPVFGPPDALGNRYA